MDHDSIWLQGREAETRSLSQILLSIEDVTTSQAVRDPRVNDRNQRSSDETDGDDK